MGGADNVGVVGVVDELVCGWLPVCMICLCEQERLLLF